MRSARSKKTTSGPVSTMASIAAKAREVARVRGEIGNAGIDDAARAFHQLGQIPLLTRFAGRRDDESKARFDQVLERAAT
jgi:hypothetical protein